MSTLRKQKQPQQLRQRSVGYPVSTKKRLQPLKAALIGCLMTCVVIISGCQSASRPLPDYQKITVDASLMVEPNYTSQMLSVLSE
ncbi:outer membrane lipoprotein Rz1 [Pantoea phage vB_PdeP_F1M1C]|nr:outer membrane lipoprotein Rz1 [Pantoea phage vB_PdeP_F1M1C]